MKAVTNRKDVRTLEGSTIVRVYFDRQGWLTFELNDGTYFQTRPNQIFDARGMLYKTDKVP